MMNLHDRLKKITHSKEFCHTVNYVVIAFAVVVGLETYWMTDQWVPFFDRANR